MKMRISILALSVIVGLSGACLAQQEEKLTITTYYPSPVGVYNQLQTKRIVIGDVNNDGQINSADVPANGRPFYVQNSTVNPLITAAFANKDGYGLALGSMDTWTSGIIQSRHFQNGQGTGETHLALNPAGGNVGIGTTGPLSKLHILNNLASGAIDDFSKYQILLWNTTTAANSFGLGISPGTLWFNSNDKFQFRRNGSETAALTINATGVIAPGEIIGTLGSGYAQFRAIAGNYGVMLRNDGFNTWLLLTNSGNQYGVWNGLRPIRVQNSDGQVIFGTPATFSAGHSDLAENFRVTGNVLRGSLVSIDNTASSKGILSSHLNQSLLGVVSTWPGAILDMNGFHIGGLTKNQYTDEKAPIALAGSVPTLVTSHNGPISAGDPIGISSLPGFGTKAKNAGVIVGRALEAFDPTDLTARAVSSLEAIQWPDDDGTNQAKPCFELPDGTYVGKILVIVNVSWYDSGVLTSVLKEQQDKIAVLEKEKSFARSW